MVAVQTLDAAPRQHRDSSLILHSGARPVSFDELRELPTPGGTKTHQPISHCRFVEAAVNMLDVAGFKVRRQQFGVGNNDNDFFGVLNLDCDIDEGIGLSAGLRNSHVKRFAAGLCLGETVFACDNLGFSATITILRKHTARILEDLEQKLQQGVEKLPTFVDHRRKQINRYKKLELTDNEAYAQILSAFREKIIGVREIPRALAGWESPLEEHVPGTAWALYNAFTGAIGKRFRKHGHHAQGAATRTIRLNRRFEDVFINAEDRQLVEVANG